MIKPILTIVRGLPGSGKSAYARKLAAETGAMLIEPDALLVRGGDYWYTLGRRKKARVRCLQMLMGAATMGADVIYADVLSKVGTVKDLSQLYAIDARGAKLRVIDMPLLTVDESMARNKHRVRREDIERMAREWEPWEGQK